ncbi:MAG TPA: hypothetical protein VFM56_11945 [Solimonas sp.]|nr:hypothetical protein [Solimonas sp.]
MKTSIGRAAKSIVSAASSPANALVRRAIIGLYRSDSAIVLLRCNVAAWDNCGRSPRRDESVGNRRRYPLVAAFIFRFETCAAAIFNTTCRNG